MADSKIPALSCYLLYFWSLCVFFDGGLKLDIPEYPAGLMSTVFRLHDNADGLQELRDRS